MRKRIYRISEDKFDDPKPNIELSEERISLNFYEGEAVKDSFTITSSNGVQMRGMVYCSLPYVCVLNSQFEGNIAAISYEMKNHHFKVGETIEGAFTVVVYGHEIELPFKFTCVKRQLMASTGVIDSMEAFAKLAQTRLHEAIKIFYSDEFALFMTDFDKKLQLMYKGISKAGINPANLDEFLVACGQKVPMTFDMDESDIIYYDVEANIKGELEITRSTWGYIDIRVTCDSDFVSVEKERIGSDFFLGSIFTMNYYVHHEKMHAGKNYARISFDYRDTHKEIVVMASTCSENGPKERPVFERDKFTYEICRKYEEFRLNRISCGQWTKDSIELLEQMQNYGLEENWALLYKTQLYITNKQKQEALWIIQDLKRTIPNKRSAQWAYLLYLCTLIEREESYVDRLTEDIENIFRDNPRDFRIFWFLLFLRKEYVKNPTAKLRAIAEWIDAGYETTFLYVEAYYVFLQDPYLIASFDKFTLKVLGWARRHNAITRDMAIQMIHVLESERNFNPKAFSILEACYEIYPDLKLLLSMVTYLLKSNIHDPKYFDWYKLAIDSNLHIAGIFEAYMETLDPMSTEQLPQVVTMFFRYNNNLSFDRKALLYANIILHRDEDRTTYDEYERIIERFALEQLKLGRMDDNLAVCYQRLLEIGLIDRDTAGLMTSLVFLKKLVIIRPGVRRVLLYQSEFTKPTIVTVKNDIAYLPYLSNDGCILLEDSQGFLIADERSYVIEDVMNPDPFIPTLRSLAPGALPFIVHDFYKKTMSSDFSREDIDAIKLFINSEDISAEYKQHMYPMIIEFLRLNNKEELIEAHLMNEADLTALGEDCIGVIIELFATKGRYNECYYLLDKLNCTKVKVDVLSQICHHILKERDNKPDDFLISLAAMLFDKNQATDSMVAYLIKYYIGPTDLLIRLYNRGYDMGLDCVEFAERVLIQSMYRDQMPDDIMSVFDTYVGRKTNKMVVEAFLTFESHFYLTTDNHIPEHIFSYIYTRMKKGMGVNESMRIALMKYLCICDDLSDEEVQVLDDLVSDAILRNQYFGFYSKMDARLQIKYHFYDKCFIEYKGLHRQQVIIAYSHNGGEALEEEMIEMYDGLFVKQFLLFFGDQLRYEIYTDEEAQEPVCSEEIIVSNDYIHNDAEGRYAMMNDMNRMQIYTESEELIRAMKRYQGLDVVTKEIFNTI